MKRLTFFKTHPSSLKNNSRSQYNHGNYLQKKFFMNKIGLFSWLMEKTFRDNFFKQMHSMLFDPFDQLCCKLHELSVRTNSKWANITPKALNYFCINHGDQRVYFNLKSS